MVAFSSPLQLLNALESINEFGVDPARCIFVSLNSASNPNVPQVVRLVDNFSIVSHVPFSYPSSTGSYFTGKRLMNRSLQRASTVAMYRFVKGLEPLDRLIVGHIANGAFRTLAVQSRYDELVLVDDGVATLSLQHQLGSESSESTFLSRGRDRLAGFAAGFPERLHLFTIFAIEPTARVRVTRNTYRWLTGRTAEEATRVPEVWFLGQTLVEDLGFDRDTYVGLVLKEVASLGKSRNRMVYVSHRRESNAKLDIIRASGCEVRTFDVPIECVVLDVIPAEVRSFFSTALFTLAKMLPTNVPVVARRIPIITWPAASRNRAVQVEPIYRELQRAGSRVKVRECVRE